MAQTPQEKYELYMHIIQVAQAQLEAAEANELYCRMRVWDLDLEVDALVRDHPELSAMHAQRAPF